MAVEEPSVPPPLEGHDVDGRKLWRKPTLNVICSDLDAVGGDPTGSPGESFPHDTYAPS